MYTYITFIHICIRLAHGRRAHERRAHGRCAHGRRAHRIIPIFHNRLTKQLTRHHHAKLFDDPSNFLT